MLYTPPLILQVDYAGRAQRWINYEYYAYYVSKDLILWTVGEGIHTLKGGYQQSGDQSTIEIASIVAVKGKPPKSFKIKYDLPPLLTNKALFRRDKNMCAYCGNQYGSKDLTRDHVQPVSRGGLDIWENVVAACSSCNKTKGNFLLTEIDMQLLYLPYAPNKAEHLILMNRNILADQMDFLLKYVPKESRLLV